MEYLELELRNFVLELKKVENPISAEILQRWQQVLKMESLKPFGQRRVGRLGRWPVAILLRHCDQYV